MSIKKPVRALESGWLSGKIQTLCRNSHFITFPCTMSLCIPLYNEVCPGKVPGQYAHSISKLKTLRLSPCEPMPTQTLDSPTSWWRQRRELSPEGTAWQSLSYWCSCTNMRTKLCRYRACLPLWQRLKCRAPGFQATSHGKSDWVGLAVAASLSSRDWFYWCSSQSASGHPYNCCLSAEGKARAVLTLLQLFCGCWKSQLKYVVVCTFFNLC